jgi:hypothetical protein
MEAECEYLILNVTIHSTATCIRKSSQQAVCRFYEALSFAHVGAVPASQAA